MTGRVSRYQLFTEEFANSEKEVRHAMYDVIEEEARRGGELTGKIDYFVSG